MDGYAFSLGHPEIFTSLLSHGWIKVTLDGIATVFLVYFIS